MNSKYKLFQGKVNKNVFDTKLEKPKVKRIDFDYFAICFFMLTFGFLVFYTLLRDFLKIVFNVPVQ